MPRRSASRLIESPSSPSSSSWPRAAATISFARGLSSLRALEAIAGAQTVAQCAVETDVKAPREPADEEANPNDAERCEHQDPERQPETVNEVVERDSA